MNVPDGQVDRNIWVDFNLGSKSVSAFVRDDSSGDVRFDYQPCLMFSMLLITAEWFCICLLCLLCQ